MTTPRVVSLTSRRPRDNGWSVVLEIAGALVGKIGSHERYQRVLDGIHALLHCDSAALLRLEDDELVPVATRGLVPETSALRFPIAEHPRLAQFVRDRRPVRIRDESLPDPFDGLIEGGVALSRVHACMGCALVAGDDLVGVLSVDALDAAAFDDVDDDALAAVACLAAAAIRTTDMIEQLERNAERAGQVVRELAHDTTTRVGGELLGRSPAMEALRAEVALAARAAAHTSIEPGSSRSPMAAHCSSTRSASCRCRSSRSCCARCNPARSSGSAPTSHCASTSGSSQRPTATSPTRSPPGDSARTCSIASACSRSRSRRSATAATISACSRATSSTRRGSCSGWAGSA